MGSEAEPIVEYVDANTSYCHGCESTIPNAHAGWHAEGQHDV